MHLPAVIAFRPKWRLRLSAFNAAKVQLPAVMSCKAQVRRENIRQISFNRYDGIYLSYFRELAVVEAANHIGHVIIATN